MIQRCRITLLIALVIWGFMGNLIIISAEEYDPTIPGVAGYERYNKLGEALAQEETRSEYLKEEWGKILNGTIVGDVFKKVDKGFMFFNPFFQIVLGMEYLISWFFLLSLVLWLLLLKIGWDVSRIVRGELIMVRNKKDKFANYVSWGIFIIAFLFFSTVRIPRWLSSWVSPFFRTGEWTWRLLVGGIICVAIITIAIFIDTLKKSMLSDMQKKQVKKMIRNVHEDEEDLEEIKRERAAERAEKEKKEEDEDFRDTSMDE